MSEPVVWFTLNGWPVQAYTVVLVLAAVLGTGLMWIRSKDFGLKKSTAFGYVLCAAPLALFLARLVYCAVRYEWIFQNEMGEFDGLWHFFEWGNGGMNIIGALAGCLLAGALCARLTKQKAGAVLDCAALAGALLIAVARFAQPLSGQGFGDLIESPAFSFFPLAIENEWGEWMLAVCIIEGVLALAVFSFLLVKAQKAHRPGVLSLYFLVLFCASQIMPQSLRSDDVLFIFIFARVTQIGYVIFLIGAAAVAGVWAVRRTGVTASLTIEWFLLLLGIGVCIGAEFALDKTNLPDLLVYAVMIAALLGMAALGARRIKKEDIL